MARTVGLVLLLIGLAGLAWGGFNYAQERHKVDLGPVDLSYTEKKHVDIPPVAGAAAIVVGLVLRVAGGSRPKGVLE